MTRRRFRPLGVPARGTWLLLLAMVVPLGPAEARQRPDPAPPGPSATDRADAQERLRAFRQRVAAFERARARLRDEGPRVDRPRKVVEPPTLTPAALDALLARSFGDAEPAPIVDDAAFIRRVALDLAGAPPTAEQVRRFVADDDPEKRATLIDRLLASDEFAASRARAWSDVIRYRATFQNPRLVNYPALESWLAEQFRANRPWDEIATALIAGTGETTEAGNVGFAVAHLDGRRTVSPPEFAGEVSRIFLGIQIQCAECHDHPTDPWTRRQFHEFAAFFAGTQVRRLGRPQDPDFRLEVLSTPQPPRYAMPDPNDPDRSIPVAPKFFLDDSGEPLPGGLSARRRRELAASYVTGQDNPWFPRAFINRVWAELMGEPFYLPIDDLGPARAPIAPEALDALADQWQRGGYDIRWLYRTILNTEAYQRRAVQADSDAGRAAFASNCPTRLRPDQIAGAIDQALGVFSAARRFAPARGPDAARRPPVGPRLLMDQLFGVDPSTPADEILGTIPQALFFMNSPILERAIAAPRGALARILRDHPEDGDAIEALYLQVLSRTPSAEERRVCRDYLEAVGDRREAFEDLLWSLLNSTEFLHRQ